MGKPKLDKDGFPSVRKGYTRVFTDHTGRWYEDIKTSELEKPDPLAELLWEEVQKEIDKEILRKLGYGV